MTTDRRYEILRITKSRIVIRIFKIKIITRLTKRHPTCWRRRCSTSGSRCVYRDGKSTFARIAFAVCCRNGYRCCADIKTTARKWRTDNRRCRAIIRRGRICPRRYGCGAGCSHYNISGASS